jgi:hypothetical protein
MFSDHLRKIDEAPHKTLLLVAAGLVMVCQLVAMALVAGEQVQKAQMRGDSQASRQVAMATCIETSRGVAVKGCFQLGSYDLESQQGTSHTKGSGQSSMASVAPELDTIATPATSAGALSGFMSASFAVR